VAVSARRVGVLAPGRELPGELQDVAAAAAEPVALWQVVTASDDDHGIAALRATAEERNLLAGVERLARWQPDVVAWACTSGSFVGGRAGALAQIEAVERAAGVPATSTSLAFVEAAAALGIDAVAVVAPYPDEAAAAFSAFLGEWGIAVRESRPLGCAGPSISERLTVADLERDLAEIDPGLALLLPDTAVWGIELLPELAARRAAPVLVANQVTLWHAFDLIGLDTELPALGALAGVPAPAATRGETLLGRGGER
jgi:maleate cis-trans isomerase